MDTEERRKAFRRVAEEFSNYGFAEIPEEINRLAEMASASDLRALHNACKAVVDITERALPK